MTDPAIGKIGRIVEIDMRVVPMIRRLDTILAAWKQVAPGHSLRIRNDREPRPLFTLFRTAEKGRFEWVYEVEGPDEWVALITRLAAERDRG